MSAVFAAVMAALCTLSAVKTSTSEDFAASSGPADAGASGADSPAVSEPAAAEASEEANDVAPAPGSAADEAVSGAV
ncbi:hypothetical protein SDC9_135084 [bioreactor metagenome]|uniref:Uncharacterized protein n=1 Tax=bioreactor metagenome TaxID=1076179 RepID=A0A645DGN4_9ZZZZ